MKLSFEQGIAAGVAGLVATALVAGVLLVDHSAIAAPAEPTAQLQALPAPSGDAAFRDDASHASVVFAGGCFWGVQGVFQHVKGVIRAVSGYAGGDAATATYGQVGSGRTGHAESVQITYDPSQVTYGELLQVFFSVVTDPTEVNRQGPDTGTQYRSVVFPRDAMQQKVAAAYIAQLGQAGVYDAPIATTIEVGKDFYRAEAEEQNFLALNPDYGYIVANDLPKIERLGRLFPQRYRAQPVLVEVRAR